MLRRSFALSRVVLQHRRRVEALGEVEWPSDERRRFGSIGMERIHQHDVRLREDSRAHRHQQATTFLEPGGHPVADHVIAVGVGNPLGNNIDLCPADYPAGIAGPPAPPARPPRRKFTTGTSGGE